MTTESVSLYDEESGRTLGVQLMSLGRKNERFNVKNWLRTSLPRMAEVVEPLLVFLEQLMAGASRRTKRVVRNRVIQEDAWMAERVRAWRAAQDLVTQAVPLYHPRSGCIMLMFTDASDFHWGSFLTQVPEEGFRSGVALENMSHGLF